MAVAVLLTGTCAWSLCWFRWQITQEHPAPVLTLQSQPHLKSSAAALQLRSVHACAGSPAHYGECTPVMRGVVWPQHHVVLLWGCLVLPQQHKSTHTCTRNPPAFLTCASRFRATPNASAEFTCRTQNVAPCECPLTSYSTTITVQKGYHQGDTLMCARTM